MVQFQVPIAHGHQSRFRFSVPARAVGFAGSRSGSVSQETASSLVSSFASLGFSFYTGCAPGVDACFRAALAGAATREQSFIACAFDSRARRHGSSGIYASVVVPEGLTPRAALHRRTVWMVRRCSLLVLVPESPPDCRWGPGSRLAFRTALANLIPVFVAAAAAPPKSEHYRLLPDTLFGVLSGFWVVPHPVTEGGPCDEQW